eukprot:6206531-Pleurochrysis_carterae.AAC.2
MLGAWAVLQVRGKLVMREARLPSLQVNAILLQEGSVEAFSPARACARVFSAPGLSTQCWRVGLCRYARGVALEFSVLLLILCYVASFALHDVRCRDAITATYLPFSRVDSLHSLSTTSLSRRICDAPVLLGFFCLRYGREALSYPRGFIESTSFLAPNCFHIISVLLFNLSVCHDLLTSDGICSYPYLRFC